MNKILLIGFISCCALAWDAWGYLDNMDTDIAKLKDQLESQMRLLQDLELEKAQLLEEWENMNRIHMPTMLASTSGTQFTPVIKDSLSE